MYTPLAQTAARCWPEERGRGSFKKGGKGRKMGISVTESIIKIKKKIYLVKVFFLLVQCNLN